MPSLDLTKMKDSESDDPKYGKGQGHSIFQGQGHLSDDSSSVNSEAGGFVTLQPEQTVEQASTWSHLGVGAEEAPATSHRRTHKSQCGSLIGYLLKE